MESTLPDKEAIKRWLTERGKDRAWLAEQLGVRKDTVVNWLSRGRAIPETKLHAIADLMHRKNTTFRDVIAVSVRFTAEELAALQAVLPPGANLEEVLREQALARIIREAEETVETVLQAADSDE